VRVSLRSVKSFDAFYICVSLGTDLETGPAGQVCSAQILPDIQLHVAEAVPK